MRFQTSSVVFESLSEMCDNAQKIFGYPSRVRNRPEDFVLSDEPALYLGKMHSFLTVLVNN